MTVFWWITGALLALTLGTTAFGWVAYIVDGDDRYQAVARAAGRWSVVVVLAAFNIAIFTHIIGTLLGD